jgi:hypothetical protein
MMAPWTSRWSGYDGAMLARVEAALFVDLASGNDR